MAASRSPARVEATLSEPSDLPSEARPLDLAPVTAGSVFPTLSKSPGAVSWMRPRPPEISVLTLSGPGSVPRAPSAPPRESPAQSAIRKLEAEITRRVEAEIAAAQIDLDAMKGALDAERAKLEAERTVLAEAKARFTEAAAALGLQEVPTDSLVEPLLELSVGIAEAIVEDAIERESGLHERLAKAALEALGTPEGAELRASPEAYDALMASLGAPELRNETSTVPILRDATLEGLGCVARAGRARVDGRVRERLAAVRDALVHERRLTKEEP